MTNEDMAFERFVTERREDLQRIARHTHREHELSDVRDEAWLLAHRLRVTEGIAIDFLNRQHQDLILSHLYQHLVRYTEQQVRYAIRLDHAPHGYGPRERSRTR